MEHECQCDRKEELERAFLAISQLKEALAKSQRQIEAVMQERDSKISLLEQDKHNLQMKLDRQIMMAASYQDDLEATQKEFEAEKKLALQKLESRMLEQVEKQKRDVLDLQCELEKVKSAEVDLTTRKNNLEMLVDRLRGQLREKEQEKINSESFSSSDSSEKEAFEKQKTALIQYNSELQSKLEQMEDQILLLKNHLQIKDAEINKMACENTSFYNEKERLLEKIKDLKAEVELANMLSEKKQTRGNSLFAEVEDRRVEVEKQLISFRIENDSLKTQLRLTRDNLTHAKMQLSVMWDVKSAMENKKRLESLNMDMLKLVEENRLLTHKLNAIEEEEKKLKLAMQSSEPSRDAETRRYQILYESRDRKVGELTKELHSKRMILILAEDNLRKAESELHSVTQKLLALRSEKDKVDLKLEALINKYEPDSLKAQPKPKKQEFIVEKLNFSSRRKFQSSCNAQESATIAANLTTSSAITVASDSGGIEAVASTSSGTETVASILSSTEAVASTLSRTETVASTSSSTETVASTLSSTETVALTLSSTEAVASTLSSTEAVASTSSSTKAVASTSSSTEAVASTSSSTEAVASTVTTVLPLIKKVTTTENPSGTKEPVKLLDTKSKDVCQEKVHSHADKSVKQTSLKPSGIPQLYQKPLKVKNNDRLADNKPSAETSYEGLVRDDGKLSKTLERNIQSLGDELNIGDKIQIEEYNSEFVQQPYDEKELKFGHNLNVLVSNRSPLKSIQELPKTSPSMKGNDNKSSDRNIMSLADELNIGGKLHVDGEDVELVLNDNMEELKENRTDRQDPDRNLKRPNTSQDISSTVKQNVDPSVMKLSVGEPDADSCKTQ